MKRLSIILLTLIAAITVAQAQKFKLTGQITGAEKGDTLRFDKIDPSWSVIPGGFDVIIGKHGKIKYSGEHDHTQYYGGTYLPIKGKATMGCVRRLSMIITDGTIKVTGTRKYIYHSRLEGGVYDNELSRIRFIEDSVNMIRSGYMQLMETANEEKDTLKAKKYGDLANNFYGEESVRESMTAVRKMKKEYKANNPNEFVACEVAMNPSAPLEEIKNLYAKFTPAVQESYYGKYVKDAIDELNALETGKPAPDFTLTTTKGDTITMEQFKGKYLLIYHFGMCPGSMQIDQHVVSMYEKYKEHFNVLTYTSSLKPIREFAAKVKEGQKMMGIDLKAALTSMTSHPWEHEAEGESTPENTKLYETYKFMGLPYFILISPEGKMLGRGFHPVFEQAGNILEKL